MKIRDVFKRLNLLGFAAVFMFSVAAMSLTPVVQVQATPSYEIFSMNSPAERLEFEDIVLGFTNNDSVDVAINKLTVQRVGFEPNPINVLPEGDGADPGTDQFTAGTVVSAGETAEIGTVGIGSPASWRGWYGGGNVELEVWVNFTPQGESQVDDWQPVGGTIIHEIEQPPCEPEDYGMPFGGFTHVNQFSDNGNGSATLVVDVRDCTEQQESVTGLALSDFNIYQMDGVVFGSDLGTLVAMREASPGVYTLTWRHVAGYHDQLALTIQEGEVETEMSVTITVNEIKKEADKIQGISSNIGDIKDPSNTEKELTFTKTAVGSISFGPGLDLVTNQEQLALLADSIKIEVDEATGTMRAQVDTAALSFVAGKSATIQFFNVAEILGLNNLTVDNFKQLLNIEVFDDGVAVGNLSDYFSWDNVTYDQENDVLTLPVHHFTEYVLGAVSADPATATGTEDAKLAETGEALSFIVPIAIIAMTALVIGSRRFTS